MNKIIELRMNKMNIDIYVFIFILKIEFICIIKVFEGLCEPWKDSLLVKLMDKSIGYHTMKDRLTRIWKLSSGFDIMAISNDYYMIKFDLEEDQMKVIEGGPCMIFDHYLTVHIMWMLWVASKETFLNIDTATSTIVRSGTMVSTRWFLILSTMAWWMLPLSRF